MFFSRSRPNSPGHEPLLPDDPDVENELKSRTSSRSSINSLTLLVLLANIILLSVNIWSTNGHFFPAKQEKLVQQRWNLVLGDVSPYTAPPSPEVEARWEDISADGPIGALSVGKDELSRLSKTSIPLPDDPGYLAPGDVFHQLHCLNYLCMVIYNDTYYHMGVDKDPVPHAHIPHCIDSIRLSLQCSADTSLITFHWLENWPAPWPDFSSVHQCRDWDAILAAAKGGPESSEQVRHPTLSDFPKSHWNASGIPLSAEDVHVVSGS